MNKILWLIVCLMGLVIGSAIIAVIVMSLGLHSVVGTMFGLVLGAFMFMLYTEKADL